MGGCTWKEDQHGFWETACGHFFEFTTNGPAENEFRYCPFCGCDIEEVKREQP